MVKRLLCLLILSLRIQASDEVVAAVLILEAGGEKSRDAMPAVFEVIQNRAKTRDLSHYEVVRQPKQFSCLNKISDEEAVKIAKRHAKWYIALKIVKENKKTNLTKGANHYYAISIKAPYWAKEDKFKVQIGNHRFYKL